MILPTTSWDPMQRISWSLHRKMLDGFHLLGNETTRMPATWRPQTQSSCRWKNNILQILGPISPIVKRSRGHLLSMIKRWRRQFVVITTLSCIDWILSPGPTNRKVAFILVQCEYLKPTIRTMLPWLDVMVCGEWCGQRALNQQKHPLCFPSHHPRPKLLLWWQSTTDWRKLELSTVRLWQLRLLYSFRPLPAFFICSYRPSQLSKSMHPYKPCQQFSL